METLHFNMAQKGNSSSMGKLKIHYYGLIWNIVSKEEEEVIHLSDDTTVRDLLHSLVQRYGDGFRSMIVTPEWELLNITMIHLNDRDINELDGLNTKLDNNSELSITVLPYEIIGG